jgi:hypothetical protein
MLSSQDIERLFLFMVVFGIVTLGASMLLYRRAMLISGNRSWMQIESETGAIKVI